jgi:hypothetical protein
VGYGWALERYAQLCDAFNRFRCWRGIMMRWRAALDGSDRLVQSQGNGCATDATDCRSMPGRAATSAIAPTK